MKVGIWIILFLASAGGSIYLNSWVQDNQEHGWVESVGNMWAKRARKVEETSPADSTADRTSIVKEETNKVDQNPAPQVDPKSLSEQLTDKAITTVQNGPILMPRDDPDSLDEQLAVEAKTTVQNDSFLVPQGDSNSRAEQRKVEVVTTEQKDPNIVPEDGIDSPPKPVKHLTEEHLVIPAGTWWAVVEGDQYSEGFNFILTEKAGNSWSGQISETRFLSPGRNGFIPPMHPIRVGTLILEGDRIQFKFDPPGKYYNNAYFEGEYDRATKQIKGSIQYTMTTMRAAYPCNLSR